MLVKRNGRHCLMNVVCIIFMIISFVLAGCSASEKMTVEKLKEVAPVSSYEKVSEMKTIQLHKIITGEDIYAVTIEDFLIISTEIIMFSFSGTKTRNHTSRLLFHNHL